MMECLIGIGTGIFGKFGEYIVQPVGCQLGYLINFKENLRSLQSQVSELDARRQTVERKLKEEKNKLREAEPNVKKWLTDVRVITGEAKDILKEEHQAKMKCLHGFCPNLVLRYQLSRKSAKMDPKIAVLEKKEFAELAFDTTPQEIRTNYEALNSRTEMVGRIMDVLRNNPKTEIIGVYGIGGVGKTTLVKEVSKQAAEEKTFFDDVVMVLDIKKDPSIERIQKEIAEKLRLDFPENESVAGKARRLFTRIKDQKTLVILDDVWERIDLEAMGLVGVPTCKVLLTSRTREVLLLSGEMHEQEVFQLDVLTEKETWNLFEKMAGDTVKDLSIRTVAMKVAKRCGGLPVLVVTVASALKNRSTLSAWNDALRRMKKLDKEEFKEKTYLALEWSYSQLNDNELKLLFLLCGLFARYSNSINILDIFKYSMGLGLWQDINALGEAWDALNSLLEKLKDSCLLLDGDSNEYVKMHDLVNDVASRIAYRDQHVLKIAREGELKEWPGVDFLEKSTMIILKTCNIPKLPEVLQCKELKLFHVAGRVWDFYHLEIPDRFFEETKKLKVLDLRNLSIPSLPSSLEFLKNLQTLCLDWSKLEDIALVGKLENLEILSFQNSKFKELPIEIGQLTCLRLLDLTGCYELEVISPGVISSLTRLEELRMRNSFNKWEAEGVNIAERKNASLSELEHLSRLSVLQIHILDASILPTDIFSSALERYQIYVGTSWTWWDANENLNTLKLKLTAGHELEQAGVNMLLKRTDELHLDGTEESSNAVYQFNSEDFQQLKHLHVRNADFTHIVNEKGVTRNLTKLVVSEIDGLRFLLSSSVAKNLVQLTHLEVSGCLVMEAIISSDGSDEENMENMFSKLQFLKLTDLPNLTRFCSRNYIKFQSLGILQSKSCNEIEEIDSKQDLENAVEHCLFDKTLGFPSLNNLSVSGLKKLMRIWDPQNSPENFQNLETVDINSCEKLNSVFPSSMIKSLNLLTDLEVNECEGLVVIVANENGLQTTPMFVFSKVETVVFQNLPQLRNFYPGMHVSRWPSLEYLSVGQCEKVELFAQELSSFQRKHESINPSPVKGSLFLIDNDSFPKLDNLKVIGMKIWDSTIAVKSLSKQQNLQDVFRNLTKLVASSIDNSRFLLSSSTARSLVQLIRLDVSKCLIMEEIVSRKESDEGNMEKMFPKLQDLDLSYLPNLTRFCSNETYNEIDERDSKGNLEIQHFLFDKKEKFPNLKELSIDGLKSIRGICHNQISPECLKNLETISIDCCERLKNVFSSSMARNLQQLREMKVVNCGVEEIVSNEEGPETPPTFVFSKVTRVVFSKLPQLGSFYPGKHISSWPSLKALDIKECDKVEIFFQEFSSTRELLESTNHDPIKGTLFLNKKGVFGNLTMLVVSSIGKSRFLLSSSMARRLVQLTHLKISGCPIMEEIISTKESDKRSMENMFTKLQQLELRDLPNLTRFSSKENSNKTEERDSKENFENVVELFLFDKKEKFQNLKSLFISGLTKLMRIWNNQTSPECFKNLETVRIHSCQCLKNVFPFSMAGNLQQLRSMEVVGCGVEEIVSNIVEGLQTAPRFVFSKVTRVKFHMLPQLGSFYPGMHISSWPLLETLEVHGCNRVEIFAPQFPGFQGSLLKGTLFLINKDSFPNLKQLTVSGMKIWEGPFPVKFFSKLNFLCIDDPQSKSATVLEKFFDLEKLNVTSALSNKKVNHEGSDSSGDTHAVSTLPHLRELQLSRMSELMHLGEDYSQPGAHNFPNLEILKVKNCNSLKNLRSSVISFKNLTCLKVSSCSGLQYLITHSTAESLMQLTKLKVLDCKGLVEIVGSNEGDDSGNKIAFSKLKHLKLSNLPRLRGFCSGNCIVKFPSLETLNMSNRLKLIIFPSDETLKITYKENADRPDTDIDNETVMDGRMETTTFDDYCASTLCTTSLDSSCPKNITEEGPGVSTELISARPLINPIHEIEDPPKNALGDQGEENAKLEEGLPNRQVETNNSRSLTPNVAEACQDLDNISAHTSDQNSNPQILANEVGQDIDIMEGNIEIAPRVASEVESVADQGTGFMVETSRSNIQITPAYSSIVDLRDTSHPILDVWKFVKGTTDETQHFQSLQPLQAMPTEEEPQQVDVFPSLTPESDRSLKNRLSALAAITKNTKVILSSEDEAAKAVVLNVQADLSQIQYDVQVQERLKEALQHLKDKKLCNLKKLSSAMTSLNLIPQMSLNALALRRKISALQEEEQALQVEKANLNCNVAGIESSYSALVQNRAALKELHQEILSLQSKASTMAGEIRLLEDHIKSILTDTSAFEENASKIDVNNTNIHEVETELVNIEASLDRHTNVVTRLLKSLF